MDISKILYYNVLMWLYYPSYQCYCRDFYFHIFSTDPENCHGMIILWSRYIVGQATSLSLLASFHVSEARSHWFTTLAGTRCVDWWELLFGCGKNGKTLKNMLVVTC